MEDLTEGASTEAPSPNYQDWRTDAWSFEEKTLPNEDFEDIVEVDYPDLKIKLGWNDGYQVEGGGIICRNFSSETITYVKGSGLNVIFPAKGTEDLGPLLKKLDEQYDYTSPFKEVVDDERTRLFKRTNPD